MTKYLRDFTVEELEALPITTVLIDLTDDEADRTTYLLVKRPDGRWHYSDGSGYGPEELLRVRECQNYQLRDEVLTDPLREALQPFANMAESYADKPDDYRVMCDSARDVTVTVGDFRRALRALEGK